MESRGEPHTHKYRKSMNDWNYDTSCMLTSLTVWQLENFKLLISVAKSVYNRHDNKIVVYSLKLHQDFYTFSTQNLYITNIVTTVDTVGLACERYNFNLQNVKFHTVFLTPEFYVPISRPIILKKLTIFKKLSMCS
jgi:hypothetical protein